MQPQIAVIGGGLIGLSVAAALARRSVSVALFAEALPGSASAAAAGMLAPSVERATGSAHDFAVASRDMYPAYLAELERETGIAVPLNTAGVLQIALNRRAVKSLRAGARGDTVWLEREELTAMEPALSHAMGAAHSPRDGAVDNVMLLEALAVFSARSPSIERIEERIIDIARTSAGVRLRTATGREMPFPSAVLAAGAWSGQIAGSSCAECIVPARGQMLSWDGVAVSRVVYGPRGYLVPRDRGQTLAGSTMESVGFDASTTEAGMFRVRMAAEEIFPSFSRSEPTAHWAGLRPVTPDLLPLLGRDPGLPALIHASGHSRNGILLAPLTGEVVADLVTGQRVEWDLTQFRPERFRC